MTMVLKNAPMGKSIIMGTANPLTTLKFPNSGKTPIACMIVSIINIPKAAIKPKTPYIEADILVKGVSLIDLISFTFIILYLHL